MNNKTAESEIKDTASRGEDRESTSLKQCDSGPKKGEVVGKPNLQGFSDGKKKNRFSLNTIGKGSVRMRYFDVK
jgi:hypothetical protein